MTNQLFMYSMEACPYNYNYVSEGMILDPEVPQCVYTVEPPNKGHFGNRPVVLCSEVVPISEVHQILIRFLFLKSLDTIGNYIKHMVLTIDFSKSSF